MICFILWPDPLYPYGVALHTDKQSVLHHWSGTAELLLGDRHSLWGDSAKAYMLDGGILLDLLTKLFLLCMEKSVMSLDFSNAAMSEQLIIK